MLVPPGHDPDRKRPWNGQFRVIEANGNVLRRIVRAVDAIGDISDAGECLESVGASVGDVHRHLPVPLQFEALPVPIGRRARAQVDDDVEDRPVGASDQLRLPRALAARGDRAPPHGEIGRRCPERTRSDRFPPRAQLRRQRSGRRSPDHRRPVPARTPAHQRLARLGVPSSPLPRAHGRSVPRMSGFATSDPWSGRAHEEVLNCQLRLSRREW